MLIFTWRDRFFEDSDELHSVHRLPLSLSLSLTLHSVANSIVSVAAQRSQRIIFLPRSSVGASHGAGSVGDKRADVPRCELGVFHSKGAGNVNDRGAECVS